MSRIHDIVDVSLLLISVVTRDSLTFPGSFLRIAGAAFLAIGVALAAVSARHLRQAAPDTLLTSGPYRFVRHPYYLGTLTALLGLSLALLSLWGLLMALSVAPLVAAIHASQEEEELGTRFGENWDAYTREVPFIFPRLLRIDVAA